MTKQIPSHLRLHVESVDSAGSQRIPLSDELNACIAAFTEATGWAVRSLETSGDSISRPMMSPQHHVDTGRNRMARGWKLVEAQPIDGMLDAEDILGLPMVSMHQAERLFETIKQLEERLKSCEGALRRQEAELATSVGLAFRPDEQEEIAERLESTLSSTARAVGSQAAALYMLDEATSHLKMRACWGLPVSRLADGPRELRGSLADLEALMGNAVLLDNLAGMPEWKSPEVFGAALCLPIGSPTMPHGTIWFWSEQPKKYSAADVEIANLAASRIMTELERSILGSEVHAARQVRNQLDAAGVAQASRLPDSQPLHDSIDVDGWTFQNGTVGGGFHDWDVSPRGTLVFAVGQSTRSGPEGSLVSASMQSVIRTHWPLGATPSQLARYINDVQWGHLDADFTASASLIQLNPESGYGSLCNAGKTQAFIVSHRGFRPIGECGPVLAGQPDPIYTSRRFHLQPGEVLVAFSNTVVQMPRGTSTSNQKSRAKLLDQNSLLQTIRSMLDESANDIAGHLARMLPDLSTTKQPGFDRSLLVIRNCRKPSDP